MTRRGEKLFGLLLQLYPRDFRERYRADLLAFFHQDRDHPKYGAGPLRPVRFWTATTRDVMQTAWRHRHNPGRRRAAPPRSAGRWRRDLRFAWRAVWAAPAVTLAALAVLTIGIGASTAIFSVVDAVVLRGLPYPDDHELVFLRESSTRGALGNVPVRPQTYAEWRQRQRAFTTLGAYSGSPALITTDEPIETLTGSRVTASLFEILGGRAALGRVFTEADEKPGARPVAILSDRIWRSRFSADPRAIGRMMAFKSGVVEVVGVMPPDFRFPASTSADVWTPIIPTSVDTVRGNTRNYRLGVVGRLRPGLSAAEASAEMARLNEALVAEDAHWFGDHGVSVQLWQNAIVNSSVRSWMMLLLAAVAGVLLIACLNVANLLVARAVVRAPELAMRTALGASRWDLTRALLLESLILSVLGAVAGVVLAIWGVEILRSSLPANVPRLATVALDLRVILVAAGAAIGTGLLFGTLPALQVSRPDLVTLVGQGGRSHSGGRTSRRVRTALVIGEVAIASVLLVGSGMFLSSFVRVTSIELGFDPRHVISLTGGMASTRAIRPAETAEDRAEATAGQTLVASAMQRLSAVPGVRAVAAVGGGRPLGGTSMTVDLRPANLPADVIASEEEPFVRCVTVGYLDVLRGTLLRGRWIAETDVLGAEPVIVLSDDAARAYFGSVDPMGQRVVLHDYERTVVGIVRAMRFRGPESEIGPEVFVPFLQGSYSTAELMVRTEPDPMTLVPALHASVRPILPAGTSLRSQTLEQDYSRLLAQRKFNMMVLAIFGVVAIAVAAIGIYGLMAHVVEQRRREIGVRVALGADPVGILRMVLGRATMLMVSGLAVGVAASALLERLVRAFLFEPQPHDPIVYGAAAVALLAAGLLAAFGPARRAARVDPLVALRSE